MYTLLFNATWLFKNLNPWYNIDIHHPAIFTSNEYQNLYINLLQFCAIATNIDYCLISIIHSQSYTLMISYLCLTNNENITTAKYFK